MTEVPERRRIRELCAMSRHLKVWLLILPVRPVQGYAHEHGWSVLLADINRDDLPTSLRRPSFNPDTYCAML